LARTSGEVVSIIDETLASGGRPRAIVETLALLEGELSLLFGRVQRAAGGSDLAFGAIRTDGTLVSNDPLFQRIDIVSESLVVGQSTFFSSDEDGLVALTPTEVEAPGGTITLVVALAREAPVVRLGDFGRGWLLIGIGALLIAALLARVFSRQLVARLQPLSAASRELAVGNLAVRVPEMGDPDLDGVGLAFNEMASEIESTRERERDFLLGVGHDLRTPLTTIGGYAEALETESLDSAEVARIGEVLGVQSRQLSRLIEDLSLLARLEQPEFSVRGEDVDIGSHISEVVAGFERKADQAGIRLETEAEDDVVVTTDPDRLAQIARNLIENALRFTPETGRVLVTVSAAGDGSALLEVSDTGTGIDPEDLPHVLERHYVGRTRRVRDEGTGLGLSIVRGLTERLGGTVVIESEPGKGTSVTVKLPR
jgi:signal transduction histidine kinase